jgi:hypothetical protein
MNKKYVLILSICLPVFFYAQTASVGSSNIENEEGHRVWINLTNLQGAFKQILVGYVAEATNSWDLNYDAVTLDTNKYLDFYSINEDKKLVIQARALPFSESDFVPLGYKSASDGDFTISIDHADGDLTTHDIYLEDKKTNIIHDLRAGDYTFVTTAGTFTNRFILRYTNKALRKVDIAKPVQSVLISVDEKVINVVSTIVNISEVAIFDLSGKLLYNNSQVGSTSFNIADLQSEKQVLLVKVSLDNNSFSTTKILF